MVDLEFYHDEDGNPCVRGRDDRLATFIQTDLQEATGVITDLIALLKSDDKRAEFNGNAHSVSITPATAVIESNFDDEAPDRRLRRDELLEHVEGWLKFVMDKTPS